VKKWLAHSLGKLIRVVCFNGFRGGSDTFNLLSMVKPAFPGRATIYRPAYHQLKRQDHVTLKTSNPP